MRASVTSDLSTAWQLPFSPGELETALLEMWRAFAPGLTAPFPEEAVLELALVDEAEMARLNRDHLGCSGPTNILAFPADPALATFAPGAGLLALSPRTLRREAALYGQEAAAYTLRLLAHGLAHLLGYEHGPEMDEASARAAQAAHIAHFAQNAAASRFRPGCPQGDGRV